MEHIAIYILWFMGAVFNAVMDRTENSVAFNKSIFSHRDPKFWCKDISWQYAKKLPFTRYKLDAWHIAKSMMIICLAFSLTLDGLVWWEVPILGTMWNAVFTFFYHDALKN